MIGHYYRNVHAVVFCYDVTNPASFENLTHWINEYQSNCSTSLDDQTIPKLLVGNKCDLSPSEIKVSTNQAQQFADMYGMPLFETSAKDDSKQDHVDAIFMTLALKLKSAKPFFVPNDLQKVKTPGGRSESSANNDPCSC
jgi:Ras-related protein Rab-33B